MLVKMPKRCYDKILNVQISVNAKTCTKHECQAQPQSGGQQLGSTYTIPYPPYDLSRTQTHHSTPLLAPASTTEEQRGVSPIDAGLTSSMTTFSLPPPLQIRRASLSYSRLRGCHGSVHRDSRSLGTHRQGHAGLAHMCFARTPNDVMLPILACFRGASGAPVTCTSNRHFLPPLCESTEVKKPPPKAEYTFCKGQSYAQLRPHDVLPPIC